MKLEVPSSTFSYTDDDQKNLNYLLEAFGSVVSLEDIASAYCQADRNLEITSDILCSKQDSTAGPSTLKSPEFAESTASVSSGCPSDSLPENAVVARLKPKRSSASVGTVSSVIGRGYITPKPQPNESHENHKPVKLNSDDFPVSEIWNEKELLETTSRDESMNRDIEEFLFKMLGNGFQMDMSVIHDVVGQCGYSMQTSIDKLLDLSASTLQKSDDVVGTAARKTMEINVDLESMQSNGKSLVNSYSESINESTLPHRGKKKNDIPREILESLFRVPGKIEEKPESTRPVRLQSRRSPYGQVVTKPLEETIIEDFNFITRQPVNNSGDEGNDNEYEELRKSVMEYWVTMKEYYKAAVDAFTKGDYEKAQEFLEEGHFFMKKARESDEKSAQKLIGNSNEQEEFSLNMHYLDPKDAVRHLRLHLTSLCGLPSFYCLKVVVGTNGEDTKEGRRKRLIIKLLEKEGIQWTEEGNGWIISIRIDQIDPKKLSFANK